MVTIVFHVAKLGNDFQTDVTRVQSCLCTNLNCGDNGERFVGRHLGKSPLVKIRKENTLLFRIGRGGGKHRFTRFFDHKVGAKLTHDVPAHVPSDQGFHAGELARHAVCVARRRVVVQGWNIRYVSVVRYVHRKADDASGCGGFHGVVDGWIHRDLHVMELVYRDRQHHAVSNSGFPARGVWIDFLRIGLHDNGVFACGDPVWDVHDDLKVLMCIGRKFLQGFARNVDVPNHVYTRGVGNPRQAEIEPIWAVSVIHDGHGQGDLFAGVDAHRGPNRWVNARIKIEDVLHVR